MVGCILLAGLLVIVVVLGVGYWRLTSSPDLGAAPDGTLDGSDERLIALSLATRLAVGLAAQPHATVGLSERDLTVILRQSNPEPDRFSDPEARIRDGRLVVDAHTSLGPLSVVAVGRLNLSVVAGPGGDPDLRVDITEIDAGQVTLPSFVRDAIRDRMARSAALDGVLSAHPDMARLRPYLDCVSVGAHDVVLGFHRPGTAADPTGCIQL